MLLRRKGLSMDDTKRRYLYMFLLISTIGLLSLSLLFRYRYLTLLILGLILGFSLQRSRFCFISGFLNALFYHSTHLMKACIVAIIISNLGFGIYQYITYRTEGLVVGSISPLSLATLLGGLFFGIGMVFAGSCVLLTLLRIGEGSLTFFIVFSGLMVGSVLGESHLSWYQKYSLPPIFLPEYLGWGGSFLLQLGVLLLIYYAQHLRGKKIKDLG